ncbi:hypothetical protein DENSPDRAFT_826137 [Dentipellis sp. KUC8613]|nr:hypothetical protein DENSPDRAFT_826137 [Dentipellis sp. KUC8613]
MVSDELTTCVGSSSETWPLDSVKEKLCIEACGAFVGPMKAKDFLEAFVPPPPAMKDGRQRTMPRVSFEKMSEALSESYLYPKYIEVCEQLDEDHIMRYHDTHATPDLRGTAPCSSATECLSPDVMTYCRDRLPGEDSYATGFSIAERADVLKFKHNADPFEDNPNESNYPFEAYTRSGKDTRAQITTHAKAMLGLQFRTFVFSVLITGRYARLIRWDRSGAIVTEAFNYQDDPEPLAQFLWRYNFLSRAQRGFDESVKAVEATDDTPDLSEALEALKDYMPPKSDLYLLRMIPLGLSSSPPNQPGSALSTANPDKRASPGDEPDLSSKYYHAHKSNLSDGWDYYVTAPRMTRSMSDRSPFGRITRSLYVYDRLAKRVRHLKDTNRLVSPMHSVEHEIINELGEKKVRHISTVHAAWDVAPEGRCYDTVTPMFCDDKRICSRFAPPEMGWCQAARVYRPYRLITNELGTPIWMFENWEQVMRVMIDIFEALDDAEKAGWRHRDVSAGNIMICSGHGLLIDWDASRRSKDMNNPNETRVSDLTGTWQFMSRRRLRNVDGRHDAVDDMESVFWVLLWLALNFSVHSLHPDELEHLSYMIFDQRAVSKGCLVGGGGKDALLTKQRLNGFISATFSPVGLQSTLEALHSAFRVQPPSAPETRGMNEKRVKRALATYQEDLKDYEEDVARLEDSSYVCSLLQADLDDFDWPPYGPKKHIITADRNGSQMTAHLQKTLSAGVRQQRVAQRSTSLPREPTPRSAGRAKIMRTDDTADSRKVTRYAPLDERDEDRARKGENA